MSTQIDFTGSLNDDETRVALNLPRKILTTSTGRALTSGVQAVTEAESCSYNALLDIDRKRLLHEASLVLLPSTYGEGRLFSQKPVYNSNGTFTVTRATTATRVNSDGLVELVPYNLLSYSEQFGSGIWFKSGTLITPNATIAPNNSLTAYKVALATGADPLSPTGIGLSQNQTIPSGVYTYSIFAKAGERNIIRWRDAGFSGNYLVVNLLDGTFTNGQPTRFVNPQVIPYDNGWYRIIFTTGTITNSSLYPLRFGTTGQIGDGVSGGFVWGAQLVEGTNALPYQKTETRLNIPRLDYSLGGCPNILLEPQRTNTLTYSSSFDNAAWTKLNATVTANYGISPDGTQNADRIQFTTSNSSSIYRSILGATTDANTIYVKGVSGEKVLFGYGGNVASGTLYTLNGDWQRLEQISTIGSVFHIGNYNGGNATDILIWGAQREAGAYATSYIPTTTASVTRNQDLITRNNIYTNGLITAAGGTWFVEIRNNRVLTRDAAELGLQFTDNSGIFGFRIKAFGTARMLIAKIVGGAEASLYFTLTDIIKVAIKWNGSTADVFVNGVKVVAATAFTNTAMQSISNSNTVPKYLNEMALFPTPLTDEQCSILTSDSYPTAAAAYASLGLVSESPSCLTSTTTF